MPSVSCGTDRPSVTFFDTFFCEVWESYRILQRLKIVAGPQFGPDDFHGDDTAGVVVDGVADGEDMKMFVCTDRARSHYGAEKGDFALDTIKELFWCLVVHCDG